MVDILADTSIEDESKGTRSDVPELLPQVPNSGNDDELDNIDEYSSESTGEINKFLTDKGHPISIGPTYYTQSSLGEPVTISAAFRTVLTNDRPITKVLFVARDKSGNLVGHRTTYLDEKATCFVGTGDVNIVKRKAGILIPIELANDDFLTRYAQQKGKDISYQVMNGNDTYLKQTKAEYTKVLSNFNDSVDWRTRKEYLEKEIRRTEEEQIRWLKVWGANGKLGFDASGIKTYEAAFDPRDNPPLLEAIDRIDFDREEKNGRLHARVKSITKVEENLEQRQLQEIEKLKGLVTQK
jgi:hypothetical protein